MSWQDKMYKLGGNLFGIDEIAKIASQYPEDVNTNPIGSYGVGVQSDAKHQAASARASDMFYDMLGYTPLRGLPESFKEPMADTMSLVGGGAVELGGSLFDWAKSGFKDNNYLTAAKEDMISDYKGSFGTPYGTSISDVMDNVYKENNYTTKYDNIFNAGNMDVEDYSTKQQRVQAERAAQAQAQAQAAAKQQQILADQTRMQQGQVTQGGLGPNGGRAQAPQVTAPVLPTPVKSTPVRSVSPGGGNSRRTYSKPAATAPSVSRPRARATRGRSAPIVRQSRNGPPQNRFR
tara:strand:+ start:26 stop:898 length:873 start_codon:yes stop_codon:yes gene_type:complete